MIDRQVVDEILARTDMPSLVGTYVSLKRSGSNMTGLCPFHSEKSPSFTVFPADNSFYCFGCGVGGNAITFVRKIENLDFTEAVSLLARRAGITVHLEPERPGEKKIDRKRFFEMNRTAARFFHQSLMASTPSAKAALAYFTETRKFTMATITHFGLGYAPDDFDSFIRHMKSAGYGEEELIQANLCGRSERGSLYPAFRNRVMFPILDVAENVIAFGGRVMDDSKPKYKNSSDTPVFRKGNNLFALNFAHKYAAERMILCEGYMDVIALHAAGFPFAVATLGTAIRPEQARLMTRYTKKVVISYDSDEPGQKAADRALQILEEVGLEVSVLKIPDAKDPDEYIRRYGADRFKAVLDGSKTKFDFQFERITGKYDLSSPQGRIEALDAMCGMIAGVYSPVERDVYVQETARRLGVDPKSVSGTVAQKMRRKKNETARRGNEEAYKTISGFGDSVNPDFARMPRAARAEEAILGLLQLYPELRKKVFAEPPLLSEEDFPTDLGRRIFRFIRDAEADGGFAPEMLDAEFTPDEVGRITRMKVNRMQLTFTGDETLTDCIEALKNAAEEEKSKTETVSASSLDAWLETLRQKKSD